MLRPIILIIDDEQDYCDVVGEFLESRGLEVHTANDAGDALFRLKNAKPDLILIDVMMPQIDGLTLIGRLRGEPNWKRIPIVVVSAKAHEEDQQAAIAAGADDFLPKPFTGQELQEIVGTYLTRTLH